MSFRLDLKDHIVNARATVAEAVKMAEHGCMCMDQAVKECPSLSVERTGPYEWTLFGNTDGWYRRHRIVTVLPGPGVQSCARVISYDRDSRGEVCGTVDCGSEIAMEHQIRNAIVAFIV